jgi:hypothetical protein
MPVHDLPTTVALLKYSGAKPAAINMTGLSAVRNVRRDFVFECGSRCLARQVNLDIREPITCEAITRSFYSKLSALFTNASRTAASSSA